MTFRPENIPDFVAAFNARKDQIRTFNGCMGVELLQDVNQGNILFTYSTWTNVAALEEYRQSDLFNTTWSEVKKWFCEKPEAWSVKKAEYPVKLKWPDLA